MPALPWVAISITLITLAVFILELMHPGGISGARKQFGCCPKLVMSGGVLPGTPLPAWLSLFTAMFMHSSWLHWLGNIAILNAAAAGLERALGWRRFLLLYLVSGVLSTVAVTLINPTAPRAMIGASTAVSGVWAAWLLMPRASFGAILPLAMDSPRWMHNLRRLMQIASVCGIAGAAWGYFVKKGMVAFTGAGSRVFWSLGFASHLAGAAAGFLIMGVLLLAMRRSAPRHQQR